MDAIFKNVSVTSALIISSYMFLQNTLTHFCHIYIYTFMVFFSLYVVLGEKCNVMHNANTSCYTLLDTDELNKINNVMLTENPHQKGDKIIPSDD